MLGQLDVDVRRYVVARGSPMMIAELPRLTLSIIRCACNAGAPELSGAVVNIVLPGLHGTSRCLSSEGPGSWAQ